MSDASSATADDIPALQADFDQTFRAWSLDSANPETIAAHDKAKRRLREVEDRRDASTARDEKPAGREGRSAPTPGDGDEPTTIPRRDVLKEWGDSLEAGGTHGLTAAQTVFYSHIKKTGFRFYYEAASTAAHVLGINVDTIKRARGVLCDKALLRFDGTQKVKTRSRGVQKVNRYEVL